MRSIILYVGFQQNTPVDYYIISDVGCLFCIFFLVRIVLYVIINEITTYDDNYFVVYILMTGVLL